MAAVNNTAEIGGLKTSLGFSDLLEGLAELNKTVLPMVGCITAKGHRLKSATGRGSCGRPPERPGVGLPVSSPSGAVQTAFTSPSPDMR